MASNPQWCLTLDEWKEQFSQWIRSRTRMRLLNATIFFDFARLFGKAELAESMRRHLLADLVQPDVPAPWPRTRWMSSRRWVRFRDFLTDLGNRIIQARSISKYGFADFVDVARIYAMATGVHNTNSVQRCVWLATPGTSGTMKSTRFSMLSISSSCCVCASIPGRRAGAQGDNLIDPETSTNWIAASSRVLPPGPARFRRVSNSTIR